MKRRYLLPATFRQQIFTYISDGNVEGILHGYRLSDIVADINTVLQTGTTEKVALTLHFVRDCASYGHTRREGFRKRIGASGTFWSNIHRFLYSNNPTFRREAICTIGKLCMKSKAALLRQAFHWYLQHDPINLGSIIFELWWLTGDSRVAWIDQIGASKHYLVRWSLCDGIHDQSSDTGEDVAQKRHFYAVLSNDPHPWLAAEARYCLARVDADINFAKRPKHLQPPAMQTFYFLSELFLRTRTNGLLPAFDRFVRRAVRSFTGH